MKAYSGEQTYIYIHFNLGAIWKWVVSFTPWPLYLWKRTSIPILQDTYWVPEPFWSFWRGEKSLASVSVGILLTNYEIDLSCLNCWLVSNVSS